MKLWIDYIWDCILSLWCGDKPLSPRDFRDYVSYVGVEWAEDGYDDCAWLCNCGHYEESGLHCTRCGNEPPWGCDCSFCDDRRFEEYYADHPEERDEWMATWEAYPGELMADNVDFVG